VQRSELRIALFLRHSPGSQVTDLVDHVARDRDSIEAGATIEVVSPNLLPHQ
jgi:hypothetical protein